MTRHGRETSAVASRRRFFPAVLLALSVATIALLAVGGTSPARTIVTVAFFIVVPGCAVVGAFTLIDAALEVAVGIGLSMALTVLVSEIMLWTHYWHPDLAFALLAALSIPLLVWRTLQPAPLTTAPLSPAAGTGQ